MTAQSKCVFTLVLNREVSMPYSRLHRFWGFAVYSSSSVREGSGPEFMAARQVLWNWYGTSDVSIGTTKLAKLGGVASALFSMALDRFLTVLT